MLMARGRKTPTKIKELQGTKRKREDAKNEMRPSTLDLATLELPTSLLNEYAQKEWLKVTGILNDLQMLHDTDTSVLLAYCNEIGKYFQCIEFLKKNGFSFSTPNGFMQPRPEVKMANDSLSFAIKLSDKFGFNPASRTKIEMPKKQNKDIVDEL